jgi:hypothetical protein
MAVVINEFEVAAAPAPKAAAANTQSQNSPAPSPRLLRDLEKVSKARGRREHRLMAY